MHSTQENFDDIPEVDAGHDLPLSTITAAIENANISTVPDEGWETFLPISNDDMLMVLRNLNTADLLTVSTVNKTAQCLVRRVHIERYRTQLQGSLLWQYLPTIAADIAEVNGKAYIEFFRITTGIAITNENRPRYGTFSSCLNFSRRLPLFPANWNGSKFNEVADLQALANTILKDYPKDLSASHSLIEFINRCSQGYTDSQCVKLWHNYRILDAQITTLMLFIRMVRVRSTQAQPVDEIGFLINPQRNCWLTGFGLMQLSRIIPDIFPRLVREAIRLFKLENKNAAQQERLKQIEGLLDRLTEDDLLRYIPTEYYHRENPPNDPRAVYATYPYNIPSDPQRVVLIEAIEANYQFFMKKLTKAVLFKIEVTYFKKKLPLGELRLNESRIVSLILCSPLLLENLGNDGIVKMLCMLNSTKDVISSHPFLWPYLTFEVINRWFLLDTNLTQSYAEYILSNAKILNSLTNPQICSITEHCGPKEIVAVIESAAFRARLEEDKALDCQRENKLLMQIMASPKGFAYEIAQIDFAVGLLTCDEIIALLFNSKFSGCQHSLRNFLLQKECVINILSSAELLEVLEDRIPARVSIASRYLFKFEVPDMIKFVQDCFCRINRHPEFDVLYTTLPSELERRADHLTSAQWLTFTQMHPQIGNFIVDRYSNKLEDTDLLSVSKHYKDEPEILRKVTSSLEARAQEKKQREAEFLTQQKHKKREAERRLEEARVRKIEQERDQELPRIEERKDRRERPEQSARFAPTSVNERSGNIQKRQKDKDSQPVKSSSTIKARTPWAQYLRLALFATLGLVGFALFMLGIGSLVGIPIVMTATSTLFSFLPWSAALTSMVGGYLVYLVAFVTAAVTSVDKTHEKISTSSKKSSCSTASFFSLFDCWSEASQNKVRSEEVSLPQMSFRAPSVAVNVRPQPDPQTTFEKDHDNSRSFVYQ